MHSWQQPSSLMWLTDDNICWRGISIYLMKLQLVMVWSVWAAALASFPGHSHSSFQMLAVYAKMQQVIKNWRWVWPGNKGTIAQFWTHMITWCSYCVFCGTWVVGWGFVWSETKDTILSDNPFLWSQDKLACLARAVSVMYIQDKLEWTMSAIGVYRKCLLSLFVIELIAAMLLFVLKQLK